MCSVRSVISFRPSFVVSHSTSKITDEELRRGGVICKAGRWGEWSEKNILLKIFLPKIFLLNIFLSKIFFFNFGSDSAYFLHTFLNVVKNTQPGPLKSDF